MLCKYPVAALVGVESWTTEGSLLPSPAGAFEGIRQEERS